MTASCESMVMWPSSFSIYRGSTHLSGALAFPKCPKPLFLLSFRHPQPSSVVSSPSLQFSLLCLICPALVTSVSPIALSSTSLVSLEQTPCCSFRFAPCLYAWVKPTCHSPLGQTQFESWHSIHLSIQTNLCPVFHLFETTNKANAFPKFYSLSYQGLFFNETYRKSVLAR